MVDKIGLKGGKPSAKILWNLTESYINPDLEPDGLKLLLCSMEISFFSLRFLRASVTLFYLRIR